MYYTELVIRLILNPREISGRLFTGIVIEDIGDLLLIGIFELTYGLMLYSIVASPSGQLLGDLGLGCTIALLEISASDNFVRWYAL